MAIATRFALPLKRFAYRHTVQHCGCCTWRGPCCTESGKAGVHGGRGACATPKDPWAPRSPPLPLRSRTPLGADRRPTPGNKTTTTSSSTTTTTGLVGDAHAACVPKEVLVLLSCCMTPAGSLLPLPLLPLLPLLPPLLLLLLLLLLYN